jgi:hypothetical protein
VPFFKFLFSSFRYLFSEGATRWVARQTQLIKTQSFIFSFMLALIKFNQFFLIIKVADLFLHHQGTNISTPDNCKAHPYLGKELHNLRQEPKTR